MAQVRTTLVISPRERFSFSERALASIYQNTQLPFRLIYVTGGAPEPVYRSLQREAQSKGFELIHSDRYLSPNQARNLAIPKIDTEYAVFLDNDALVAPGWLEHLLQCADETNAWIVGPLYMIGEFERATIHMAGGRLNVKHVGDQRVLMDEQYLYDTPIAKANMRLRRRECEYVEFHCMLVRNEMFEQTGLLDERLMNLHEERDICMTATKHGHGVYIEPKSVVSYVPPPPCHWSDLPYFMLRWSEDWSVASVRCFNQKWDIAGVQHVSDEANVYEEGTVVGFASAWRSRVAGLTVSAADLEGFAPLVQAQVMTALLASVDREYFDVETATAEAALEAQDAAPTPRVIMGLAKLPDPDFRYSVAVMPLRRQVEKEPVLLRVDSVDSATVEALGGQTFMILKIGDAHQCWFALSPSSWDKAQAQRDLKPGKGGSVPLAGSVLKDSTLRPQLHSGRVGNLLGDQILEDDRLLSTLAGATIY